MKIEEFLINDQLAYIKAERYLNNGSPSGFSDKHTTSEKTSPRSTITSFGLPLIRITEDIKCENIGSNIESYLKSMCIFVHPDILYEGLFENIEYNMDKEIYVSPTASGRTVLCLDQNFFIKLSYPRYLGRMIRHMQAEKVQSACDVTKLLMEAVDNKKTSETFSFFREDSGRVLYIPNNKIRLNLNVPLNNEMKYEYGNLFRENKPYPYINEKEFLIPFFSLFGNEYDPFSQSINNQDDPPLLIQLFKKQSKRIDLFLLEDILFPLYRTYFEALLYAGIELEAHAQNMLLSVDPNFKVKRIVCRDLESAGKDIPLINTLGIKHNSFGKYKTNNLEITSVDYKYNKYYVTHSFMFDFKLGEYVVTPLIQLAKDYFDVDTNQLCISIKEFNQKYISLLPTNFFPSDWCTYDNINWEKEGKKRVYNWHAKPKYR